MKLPNTYTSQNETGCCPVPNVEDWNDQEVTFENKQFIRLHTRSIFYVPLNMGSVMKRLQQMAAGADAEMPMEEAMVLSRDLSPWKAEQLYSVTKPVDGADNVVLSGTFLTKVFEGPYKEVGKWHELLKASVESKNRIMKNSYFFYTTCPKCAKHYGKNYVIGLAGV